MVSALTLLLLVAAPKVDVELQVKKPLKLSKRGALEGVLEVRVTNRGAEPVTLQHRDVHAFRFVPESGDGGVQVLFHSCDCGFELGLETPPGARTFTLVPGEHRIITFEDFECGGGPYRAPPPGKYAVSWSIGAPAPPARTPAGKRDLEKCDLVVHSRGPQTFESRAVSVDLHR